MSAYGPVDWGVRGDQGSVIIAGGRSGKWVVTFGAASDFVALSDGVSAFRDDRWAVIPAWEVVGDGTSAGSKTEGRLRRILPARGRLHTASRDKRMGRSPVAPWRTSDKFLRRKSSAPGYARRAMTIACDMSIDRGALFPLSRLGNQLHVPTKRRLFPRRRRFRITHRPCRASGTIGDTFTTQAPSLMANVEVNSDGKLRRKHHRGET